MSKAYFDFDDTLVLGDSLLYWKSYLQKKCPWLILYLPVQWVLIVLTGLGLVSSRTLKLWWLWPWYWISKTKQEQILNSFFFDECRPRLFSEVVAKLEHHLHQSDDVVLTSASWDGYLQAWKKHYPQLIIIGTQIEWTGFLGFPKYGIYGNNKKAAKIDRLKSEKLLPKKGEDVYSYSDSTSDIPLLRLAQHVNLINPLKRLQQYSFSPADVSIIKTHRPNKFQIAIGKSALLMFGVGGSLLKIK